MKKVFIALAAAVAAASFSSCQEQDVEEVGIISGLQMTFHATREARSAGTRTEVYGTDVLWSPGDRVSVFYGTGYAGGNIFYCNIDDPAATVDFTGILNSVDAGSGAAFWAVSPYSDSNVGEGSSVRITVPSEQEAVEGSFDPEAFYSVATSKSKELSFYNVTGGLALSFANEGIGKVTIRGNQKETLAGQVRVVFNESGTPEVETVVKGYDEVILVAPEEGFVPGEFYFVSMLPVELKEGFTMEFTPSAASPSGAPSSRVIDSPVTIKRSWFGRMRNCDSAAGQHTVNVTGVTLDKTSATLTEKQTLQLTATVSPSNATNKKVTWSSSNTGVATVSADGFVTAKKAGSAKITVTTEDGGKTATCSITVKAGTVSVTGVSVSPSSTTITVGGTAQLTATVSPSNATDKRVNWSSGNTSVATVSSSGLVTAKAVGTTTITATTVDGAKKAVCTVTVQAATVPVTGVSVSPASTTITVGNTTQLTATVSPSNATDKSVTWSSGNTSVATVSSSGLVTAKSAGSTSITATTSNGYKASCSVTVNAATVYVTGVTLNKSSAELTVNGTLQLTATVSPSNATNKEVTWSSSDKKVATVSSNGLVTALYPGRATITVTTKSLAKTATCEVRVYYKLTALGEVYDNNAVDLGLSVKWSDRNLLAYDPEGDGEYFAWGEVTWRTQYTWDDYKWCKNGDKNSLTKYCTNSSSGYNGFYDGKKILEPEDDVVQQVLGGHWRMPTKAELTELMNNCTWTWVTRSGRKGFELKRNGKTIFLPAAGCYYVDAYRNGKSVYDRNYSGWYWSSELDSYFNAFELFFDYDTNYNPPMTHSVSFMYRCIGASIRAVRE